MIIIDNTKKPNKKLFSVEVRELFENRNKLILQETKDNKIEGEARELADKLCNKYKIDFDAKIDFDKEER
jgi:hypothetical protein